MSSQSSGVLSLLATYQGQNGPPAGGPSTTSLLGSAGIDYSDAVKYLGTAVRLFEMNKRTCDNDDDDDPVVKHIEKNRSGGTGSNRKINYDDLSPFEMKNGIKVMKKDNYRYDPTTYSQMHDNIKFYFDKYSKVFDANNTVDDIDNHYNLSDVKKMFSNLCQLYKNAAELINELIAKDVNSELMEDADNDDTENWRTRTPVMVDIETNKVYMFDHNNTSGKGSWTIHPNAYIIERNGEKTLCVPSQKSTSNVFRTGDSIEDASSTSYYLLNKRIFQKTGNTPYKKILFVKNLLFHGVTVGSAEKWLISDDYKVVVPPNIPDPPSSRPQNPTNPNQSNPQDANVSVDDVFKEMRSIADMAVINKIKQANKDAVIDDETKNKLLSFSRKYKDALEKYKTKSSKNSFTDKVIENFKDLVEKNKDSRSLVFKNISLDGKNKATVSDFSNKRPDDMEPKKFL